MRTKGSDDHFTFVMKKIALRPMSRSRENIIIHNKTRLKSEKRRSKSRKLGQINHIGATLCKCC